MSFNVTPQFLPHPSANKHQFIFSKFTGSDVDYVFADTPKKRIWEYGDDQSTFNATMACRSGSLGVDNRCVCPGSYNSMPFRSEPAEMISYMQQGLFSPFVAGSIPPIGAAAKKLIAQRSPLPCGAGYTSLD